MKFDMFKEMVRENISNKMGSDYEVILEDVTKNNGVILTGVLIRMPGENISPTIYLNDYYEMFKRAEISIHQIVARIIDVFNTSRPTIDFDIKQFMNYEYIKKKLVLKMVNTEKNRELLQEIPHVNYLDLSMIFQIILTIDGCEDNATITVTNQHQKMWDVDLDELVFTAKRNTQKMFPSTLNTLYSMLTELMNLGKDTDILDDISEMYIVTNSKKMNGATAIVYKDVLRNFANKLGRNYYILPSSINELILLPDDGYLEPYELKNIVCGVNASEIDADEFLSDSVYYYDKEQDVLSVCV